MAPPLRRPPPPPRPTSPRRTASSSPARRRAVSARRLWPAAALALLAAACGTTPDEDRPLPRIAGSSQSGRYLLHGDDLLRAGDAEVAAAAYHRAVDEAVRERHDSNLVQALAQLAELERRAGRPEQGEQWLEDAEERASDEEPLGWSRLLLVRALYERDAGRTDAAGAVFASLFDYCVEHELYDRALDTAHRLALQGSLGDKVAWSERGLALARELGDERWQAVLWNNLGWAYNDAARREAALEAFLRAREFHQRAGTELQRLAADYSVGRAYRLLGDVEDALGWLTPTYLAAEKRYLAVGGPLETRWLGLCQLELAEMAALLGQRKDAVRSFRRAHALLTDAGAEEWWPDGLREIEERLGELMVDGELVPCDEIVTRSQS